MTVLCGHFQLPACGPTASPVFLFSTLTLPNSTCLLSKQQALWTCLLCQQMAFSLPSCHLWYLLSSSRPSHRSCPLCCPWNPPSLLWISPALLPPPPYFQSHFQEVTGWPSLSQTWFLLFSLYATRSTSTLPSPSIQTSSSQDTALVQYPCRLRPC